MSIQKYFETVAINENYLDFYGDSSKASYNIYFSILAKPQEMKKNNVRKRSGIQLFLCGCNKCTYYLYITVCSCLKPEQQLYPEYVYIISLQLVYDYFQGIC